MVKVKVIKMLVVIARKTLISIKHQKLTMLVGVFLLKNPAAMVTVLKDKLILPFFLATHFGGLLLNILLQLGDVHEKLYCPKSTR